MGIGIGHFIPLVAYLGFWVMCLVSLTGKPLLGLYYLLPFLPYRTMRDHFLIYPLGANVLTILVVAVLIGALIKGKHLPKSKLYGIWLIYGIYLYLSMWLGTALGNAPAPIWLSDVNFATWKDYMLIPVIFVAASLVIEDRRAIKMVIILTALTLFFIDRSSLMESLSRSWTNFDESKRTGGPLGYGANQTAAFMAQFSMFIWGVAEFIKKKNYKLICYGLIALTICATMYTFSRGAYASILIGVLILGLVKNRKLLIVLGVFLLTWQAVVPASVRERVTMTKNANGQLEESAEQRVELWDAAETSFLHSPIFGAGYATFQFGVHLANLADTHNWYVKILVETGLVGMAIVVILLGHVMILLYRLFKRPKDPLYQGLGLGLFLSFWSCIISNCFGDRWTYLEITGLFWVAIAAAIRATELSALESSQEIVEIDSLPVNRYMAYR